MIPDQVSIPIQLTRDQKEKEDLDEISSELELADDDEKIPYEEL